MNTPPYVYAPILESHDLLNGDYMKHLQNVVRNTTNKQTRAQAEKIQDHGSKHYSYPLGEKGIQTGLLCRRLC